MSRPLVTMFPTVSIDYGMARPSYAMRRKNPVRAARRKIERDGGERENPPTSATHSCPACGGKALSAAGHDLGDDGRPVCLAAKAKARGLW